MAGPSLGGASLGGAGSGHWHSPALGRQDARAGLAGSGIAVLPDYLTEKALRKGELVEVLEDFRIPDIWLKALVPASRIELPRIRMLLDWLENNLKPLPPWKTIGDAKNLL